MPFDFPHDSRPERPDGKVHPDVVALRIQKDIGRPLTHDEYTRIWNKVVDSGWSSEPDHILGWEDV